MKSKAFLIFLIFLVTSCRAYKEKRNCSRLIENNEVLDIDSFSELRNYLKISANEDLTNILWLIDGTVVLSDSIKFVIDKKQFDILNLDKINQSKLSALYTNKNWSLAVLISTNKCLNKYK